jgi:LmbE family N-acetylglucosaminyl deacetylase
VTGGVVLDCVYPLARDHLAFPELLPGDEPHKVAEVHVVQWEQPRLVVDITPTIDRKLEAIACHASQVGDWGAVEARVRRRAALLGEAGGYAYAEGFDRIALTG